MRWRGVLVSLLAAMAAGAALAVPATPALRPPRPAIGFPAAGAVVCGRTELIGREANPQRAIEDERVRWAYSLDGQTFVPIRSKPLPGDSRGLRGGTTTWRAPRRASGPVTVRMTLEGGGQTASAETGLVLDRPPNNGPILAMSMPRTGVPATTLLSAPQARDPDGEIASATWLLGDGETASGLQVQHDYKPGRYVVSLVTLDIQGCSSTSVVEVTVPPTITTTTTVVDYCDPLSVTINRSAQGTATNEWPADPNDGIEEGRHPLGRIHNDQLAVAYNFEVIFQVLGDPARCVEKQLIKTTRMVEFRDGTRRVWTNPADGGAGGDFHKDGYTAPGSWKTHTQNADGTGTIAWVDDPRIYMDEEFGGTYHRTRNPVIKARVVSVVLVELDGQEAPIDHAEKEGPGETVYKIFRICAAWNAGSVIDSFTPIDGGGPDAKPPTIAEDNVGPSEWGATEAAIGGC